MNLKKHLLLSLLGLSLFLVSCSMNVKLGSEDKKPKVSSSSKSYFVSDTSEITSDSTLLSDLDSFKDGIYDLKISGSGNFQVLDSNGSLIAKENFLSTSSLHINFRLALKSTYTINKDASLKIFISSATTDYSLNSKITSGYWQVFENETGKKFFKANYIYSDKACISIYSDGGLKNILYLNKDEEGVKKSFVLEDGDVVHVKGIASVDFIK